MRSQLARYHPTIVTVSLPNSVLRLLRLADLQRMLSSAHKPLVSPVKIYRPSIAATQEPAVEEVLPNSRAAMPQKLREYILEWQWAVCTFLVLTPQSTQRWTNHDT